MADAAIAESPEHLTAQVLADQLWFVAELLKTTQGLNEVYCNTDGRVWIQVSDPKRGVVRKRTQTVLSAAERESIIRNLAGIQSRVITDTSPHLETSIPTSVPGFGGCRWHAVMPPIVTEPTINIRFPPSGVVTLDDLHAWGAMTEQQKKRLEEAVDRRETILFVGGTGTGKTTFIRACLQRVRGRLLIVEDTPEIGQVATQDVTRMLSTAEYGLDMIIKNDAMRMSPDIIILGEIRSGIAASVWTEAAANSGHNGSIASLHASSARRAPHRLKSLIQRDVPGRPDMETVFNALDLVVYIEKAKVVVSGQERTIRRIGEIVPSSELRPKRRPLSHLEAFLANPMKLQEVPDRIVHQLKKFLELNI